MLVWATVLLLAAADAPGGAQPDAAPVLHIETPATCATGASTRSDAIARCQAAVGADPSAANLATLARVLIETDEGAAPPTAEERAQALELANHAVTAAPDEPQALAALCEVAVLDKKRYLLSDCAPHLLELRPADGDALVFAALFASEEGRDDDARSYLERARGAGVSARRIDALGIAIRPPPKPWEPRLEELSAEVGGAWLAMLALLLAVGSGLSAITARLASRVAAGKASGAGPVLRTTYRLVIGVCSLFYFASLPLTSLVTLAFAAALIASILAMHWISLYLLLAILVIAAAAATSAFATVSSIFVSARSVQPGFELDLASEPRLHAVLREVAGRLRTHPIEHVRVVPGTVLAVNGRTKRTRTLLLGLALVDGLTVSALRAMVAHEYGHFIGGDTAGGPLSLSMRRSFHTMRDDLVGLGLGHPLNPTWLFVMAYEALFLQISAGSSRLQEVLADRIAARAYGGAAFEEGLRHACAADAAFEARIRKHAARIASGDLTPELLYRSPVDESAVRAGTERRWTRSAGEDDSHPPSADRAAWVRHIVGESTDDDRSMADSLFADRASLEARAVAMMRPRLPAALPPPVRTAGAVS